MKRNLITQIRNEWHDNVWIVVGLTLVGLAVWFFGSTLSTEMINYFIPVGFDEENVYVLSVENIDRNAADYMEYGENEYTERSNDLRSLINNIRKSSNVESAAFSRNATPYLLSYYGGQLRIMSDAPDTIGYYMNTRWASPDIADVLLLRSVTGNDSKFLKDKLAEGEILVGTTEIISNSYNGYRKHSDEEMLRSYVIINSDSATRYHVADIIENIRRSSFDGVTGGTCLIPIDESQNIGAQQILVRVKPGRDAKFMEEFESTPAMNRARNTFLSNMRSLRDLKESVERGSVISVRLNILEISFMILIIFLGLLGTFWFRMQQRVSEIAIRRVCGATRGDIFRRAIGEGLYLLVIAAVFISIMGWAYVIKIYEGPLSYTNLLYCEITTLCLMAAGIVLSISYPAWKAMRIEPAVAVKDE
ncbi:MAG: FtsX-like permease family protein [Bacteroidales bacterium]|nr:FtsX-like permease family protein [Bacteroidales bacterium]